jgi:hypothetical protein
MFSRVESKIPNEEATKKPVRKTKPKCSQTGGDVEPSASNEIQKVSPEIEPPVNMNIDAILEREKQHNKTESWNKLDKTIKMQKLHGYAEKYGKDNNLPVKDIKTLKAFFKDCLEKNKLQKTKEVQYNKETREITGIPSLHFNHASHNYTLKITDATRVSTLKSLTPLRSNDNV